MSRKRWRLCDVDKELASDIATEYDIDPFTALLLTSRGITDEYELKEFFNEDSCLSDPFEIKDMDKAAERIKRAMERDELIAVYGDYDADGVTATALLESFLKDMGCRAVSYIPDRNTEGYGLNMNAVKSLAEMGVQLIVTVDNGVSALKEAEYIYELGMELVITDHHKVPEVLPRAEAVVDLHRADCPSRFKHFAGVGVALKLATAICGDEDFVMSTYSDLAAIGTIGDVVSLTGENRTIVKQGLRLINADANEGIARLKEVSGVKEKQLTSGTVAFSLVPRINAIGRTGSAEHALRLLTGTGDCSCSELAEKINNSNINRQDIEKHIYLKALEQAAENPSMLNERVLIFIGEDWHAGVIGIVAARLVQKYGKPCMVISVQNELAKGSARSIEGFSLYDAVSSASELLTHYGGHVLAAGFSLESKNLDAFCKAMKAYSATVEMPFPAIDIDLRLRPDFINSDILEVIGCLEPFGAGNPQPLFGLYGMTITSIQPIGAGKHLRISFRKGESAVTGLLFSTTLEEFPYRAGDVTDLAVRLERNEYMGQVRVSVYIREIRMNGTDDDKYLRSVRLYEKIKRREPVSSRQALEALPGREFCAEVYRYLKKQGGWQFDTDVLCYRLGDDGSSACKVHICIDALCELDILKKEDDKILLADTSKKVRLEDSALLSYLRACSEKQ